MGRGDGWKGGRELFAVKIMVSKRILYVVITFA